MNDEHLQDKLEQIQIELARIGVHLQDIKNDVKEHKTEVIKVDERIKVLETFKSRTVGASMVLAPFVAFMAAIGHDLIKRLMGWY